VSFAPFLQSFEELLELTIDKAATLSAGIFTTFQTVAGENEPASKGKR